MAGPLSEVLVNVRAFAGQEHSEADRDTLAGLIAAAHRATLLAEIGHSC